MIAQNIDCFEPNKEEIKLLKNYSQKEEIKEYSEFLNNWKQINNVNTVQEMIEKKSNRGSGYTTYFEQEMIKLREELGDKFREDQLSVYSKSILDNWVNKPKEIKNAFKNLACTLPDPVSFKFNPARNYGVLSEQMENLIYNYINDDKNSLVSKSRFKSDKQQKTNKKLVSKSKFIKTINNHYLKSQCQPGENVGLLSATSIGLYNF